MSIRRKLALILTSAIAASTLVCAVVFVSIQHVALRRATTEKVRLQMDGVSRMASESLLAKDPLMLLDYLQFLRRDRPEVHRVLVNMSGRWEEIGKPPEHEPEGGAQAEHAVVPAGEGKEPIRVEIWFVRKVLERQQAEAREALVRNMARTGTVVVCLGILVCIPLSGTLTRRIMQIETAMDEIGQGKFESRVAAKGADEIARLARRVNEMAERLQELEKMKKTFVASVTHELRSPLGAIESYVKALLRDPSRWQAEDRASLERIAGSAARLSHFVTSLLDMAKIERGKLDFLPKISDISGLVEDTVLFFGPRAKEDGKRLEFEVQAGLPRLRFDPDLISQVLTNLISNALKFTKPGGLVKVTLKGIDGGIECAVADTGVGIPQEALGRIFRPFERVANPLRATGAGLGLAISKSIMDMHGGSMGVRSEVGRGSRFHFTLPLEAHPAKKS